MSTELDLEAIRKRAEAATPGPWLTDGPFVYKLNDQGVNHFYAGIQGGNRDSATEAERTAIARFIAHARTDIPALLDLVATLRTELAAKDAEIEKWRVDYASIVDQGAEIEKRQAELITQARADLEAVKADRQAIMDTRDELDQVLRREISSLRGQIEACRDALGETTADYNRVFLEADDRRAERDQARAEAESEKKHAAADRAEARAAFHLVSSNLEHAEAALREIHNLSQRTGMTFEAQSFEADRIIDAYFTTTQKGSTES